MRINIKRALKDPDKCKLVYQIMKEMLDHVRYWHRDTYMMEPDDNQMGDQN